MCNCKVLALWIRLFVHFVRKALKQFCIYFVFVQLWILVFSWICCHFKRDIDFCNFNKSFGFQEFENCTKTDFINCFLLNARFLIYRCKIEKTKPNIMLFISTINLLKKTEYFIAKRNGDLKNIFENGISIESCYYCTCMCLTTLFCNALIIRL